MAPKKTNPPEGVKPDLAAEQAAAEKAAAEAAAKEAAEQAAQEAAAKEAAEQAEQAAKAAAEKAAEEVAATEEEDPFGDVRMTLEQFFAHTNLSLSGAGFVVGVLNATVGLYPRPLRDWKAAYAKQIGEL